MRQSGFVKTVVDTGTGAVSISVKRAKEPFRPAGHLAKQCPLFGDREDVASGRVLRCAHPPVLRIAEGGDVLELTSHCPWEIVVEGPRPGVWSTRFADPDTPDGKLHVRLDRQLMTELEIVQAAFGLPWTGAELFSEQERAEYQEIHQAECRLAGKNSKSRIDLRGHSVLTIDGDDTRDIDDAIEIKEIHPGRHYILGIHIADVTAFIHAGSPRDRDAHARSTSHYLADTVLHMLPQCLSAGLCSLVPDEDRLAVSVYLEILVQDGRARIKGSRIFPSLIRSRRRLSYTEANEVLAGERTAEDHVRDALRSARVIADALATLRPKGSIQENDHGLSGALIENFMVAANHLVGRHMARTLRACPGGGATVLFRSQPGPSVDELLDFAAKLFDAGLLDATGEELMVAARERGGRELASAPSQREMDSMFQSALHREIRSRAQVATEDDSRVFSSLTGRPGQKSLFRAACLTVSPMNSGHHELGLSRYAWFTSPIRRYPDMVNHRFLKGVDAQRLSPDDVQLIHRRLVNARQAQRFLQERLDFAALALENAMAPGQTVEVGVLNFRFASPYVLMVKARIVGRELTIQIRDSNNASIDAAAFECRFRPPGRPAVTIKPGVTARLHVNEGDVSLMAGRILVNTDQWSS